MSLEGEVRLYARLQVARELIAREPDVRVRREVLALALWPTTRLQRAEQKLPAATLFERSRAFLKGGA